MLDRMKVLIPLPFYGFDPTEVAIPWKILTSLGIDIVFATPDGSEASADKLMLTGEQLGVWRPMLRARNDAVVAYGEMSQSDCFTNPRSYGDLSEDGFAGIILPGGHDKGVKPYLESSELQYLVASFFDKNKPVGAICHGVVLAARSKDSDTGKSVIHSYRTTALLKRQELLAFWLTRLWLDDYYLTYPEITVEDEVRAALSSDASFVSGPAPLLRDDLQHMNRGFVVRDRNYLSARWPGDAYSFSHNFADMLE
ncbi:MAG: protease I [Halieaceae bacterium]|jgi:protease I